MRQSLPAFVLLLVLFVVYGAHTYRRLRGPPHLQPMSTRVPSGLLPIERAGLGLACVSPSAGYESFTRVCASRPCGRMRGARRLLIGAPLDLETATLADLEALPGVGPRLALRLDAARACLRAGRASAVDRLGSIRGIGRKKAALLARFLGLDVGGGDDICSWGSWPTTSSGSDRPR